MKLNKKGFTLIELLAVVVILLAISVIAVSSISAAIERNKAKQKETKQEIIVSYAKLYCEEYKNTKCNGEKGTITLNELKTAGYLTEEEMKDADGETLTGKVCYNNSASPTKLEFKETGNC